MNKDILKLLQERYFLKNEKSWDDIAKRISKIFPESYEYIKNMDFIPSSPTLMNLNTKGERKGTLSSCFPMGIEDSIDGIFDALKEAGTVTKMGGGIGYDFSNLRSSNENVSTINRKSSGPLPFIDMFNSVLDGIRQGGVRRGAGMSQLIINHPNILDFIYAKKDLNKFNRFNFSINMINKFYDNLEKNPNKIMMVKEVITNKEYPLTTKDGSQVSYKQLWNKIIEMAWYNAEPGIYNFDIAYNQCTVTNIDSHVHGNPCNEYVNISYSSCNLGSINLSNYVKDSKFDWERFEKTIEIATIYLNKIIDNNIFPLEKIEKITKKIRPIGLGIMGLSHLLMKLKLSYNSKEALKFIDKVINTLTIKSMQTSIELAKKYGKYDAFDYDLYIKANQRFWNKMHDNLKNKIFNDLKQYGIRNSCQTSIAPTGSISFLANSSSGIEPIFALSYIRKIEKDNKQYEKVYITDPVFEEYLNKYYKKDKEKILEEILNNFGSCQKSKYLSEEDKRIFMTANDLSPDDHLNMLEVVAKNTSLSVSKTINLPKEATKEQISDIYLKAYKKRIIGVTIYRNSCREGILIHEDNNVIQKVQKRPKEVECEIHMPTINKRKYFVIIGIFNGNPYEVFTGENYNNEGEIYIPIKLKFGKIEKLGRGKYILKTEEGDYNISNGHSDDNAGALTRQISLNLRHGTAIEFIVQQLEKNQGMISFSKAIARTFKKYIKDGTKITGEACPNCGKEGTLIRESSCKKCEPSLGGCGSSLCS